MRTVLARLPWLVSALLGLLLVAGCVDREPEQRAAFVRFLQVRVIEAPGALVRAPVGEEREALGEYVAQYELIGDFQEMLGTAIQVQSRALQALTLHSMGELMARAAEFESLRAELARSRDYLSKARETADKARAGLVQADDLKPVYAAAYDKAVTQPAAALAPGYAVLAAALQDAQRAAAYAEEHGGQLRTDGALAQVQDPSVQAQLNARLHTLNSHAPAVEEAGRRLRALQPPGP